MCLNNLSCNVTKKMYMYNCIPTNMLESHRIDFSDQSAMNTITVQLW